MNNELMINKIKELCKNENITVTRLEELLGFSQGLIGRWKDKSPTLDRIIDIADHFHVSLDEIVGRGTNFNDEFLEVIYNKTNNKDMVWMINSLQKGQNKITIPEWHDYYNSDFYTEISYYTKYNESTFLINCFCEHYQTVNPIELDFYIQPDNKSEFVNQKYTSEQLKPLWICILNNLDDEAPDELKVENIKQQVIGNISYASVAKVDPTLYYKRIKEYYDQINTSEFRDFYKVITSPKYTELIRKFQEISELYNSENNNV